MGIALGLEDPFRPNYLGVYKRADINRTHPLTANANADNKYYYLQVQIAVLGYADADNNRICIPFIYIYSTYECVIFRQFMFFML